MSPPPAPYTRPPLVGLNVEFRSERVLSEAELSKVERRLDANYGHRFPHEKFQFQVSSSGSPSLSRVGLERLELKSDDAADVMVLMPEAVGYNRLAPYLGWDNFLEKSQDLFDAWRRFSKPSPITRVSVNSRNRFDVPVELADRVGPLAFISPQLIPQPPDGLVPLSVNFRISGRYASGTYGDVSVVTSVSPLVEHVGLELNLELAIDLDPPQLWHDIRTALIALRPMRIGLFEACITDQARELIR